MCVWRSGCGRYVLSDGRFAVLGGHNICDNYGYSASFEALRLGNDKNWESLSPMYDFALFAKPFTSTRTRPLIVTITPPLIGAQNSCYLIPGNCRLGRFTSVRCQGGTYMRIEGSLYVLSHEGALRSYHVV
jgi:hypothetical protein